MVPNKNFSLRGYNCFRRDDEREVRAKGGVAILVRSDCPASQVQLQTELQAVAVRVTFPFNLTVCSIYLPPNLRLNIDSLENLASQFAAPWVLLGDFNAHSPLWGSLRSDARGGELQEFFENQNIVILNDGSMTHLSAANRNESAIDISLASAGIATRFTWTSHPHYSFSDHYPISINTDITSFAIQRPMKWSVKKADWSLYQSVFDAPNLSDDVNTSVSAFCNAIRDAANVSVPKCPAGVISRRLVPWWDDEIKREIRTKKLAYTRFKRSPNTENFIAFNKQRAVVRRCIFHKKRAYGREYAENITKTTSTVEIWSKIKAISGHRALSNITHLSSNGVNISSTADMCELLAQSFAENSSSDNYPPVFRENKEEREEELLDFVGGMEFLYNSDFSMEELDAALAPSKKTSPGPDLVPYDFLKNLPKIGKICLLRLYNLIWTKSIYPDEWRTAIVIPIPKPGKDPANSKSYRPISLTSCISKVMERMISRRLMWVLESENRLSPLQTGFRKNRNTEDALIYFERAIQNAFLNRSHLTAVFLDIEKAYDMTWRHGILQQIQEWGFRGRMPLFIQEFMRERSFRVRLQDTLSTPHRLENGVPQGCILSVVLFAIAINCLAGVVSEENDGVLYVDDLTVFHDGDPQRLQQQLDVLYETATNRGFRLSSEKSVCVHFCRLRLPHPEPVLSLNGNAIPVAEHAKLLGVTFDSRLRWRIHIADVVRRCQGGLNVLRCLANIHWGSCREVLLNVYRAIVLSRLEYGSLVLSSARRTTLRSLDSIHLLGARLATGAFRTSPTLSVLLEADLMPLDLRRQNKLVRYGIRMRALPDHPNAPAFNGLFRNRFAHRPTVTRPADIVFRELVSSSNFSLPVPIQTSMCTTDKGWISPRIPLNVSLLKYNKAESSPTFLRNLFLEELHKYINYTHIYTDGSKSSFGVGSSFVHEDKRYSWTLPSYCSIFTAEIYAIWQACQYCRHMRLPLALVITDSSGSVGALDGIEPPGGWVQAVQETIYFARVSGCVIDILWTFSHIGVLGNEIADSAAMRRRGDAPDRGIPTPLLDCYSYVGELFSDLWQRRWERNRSQLATLCPRIGEGMRYGSLSRRLQVALCRLRIGHTNASHLYLLSRSQQPQCENCDQPLTVVHIFECPVFRNRSGLGQRWNLQLLNEVKCAEAVVNVISSLGFRI